MFNEKNSAIDNENFNKLGQESSNFLVMTGSITIFISFYFSIAMINEVVIGLFCIKLYRHFSPPLPLQKSLEASNQDQSVAIANEGGNTEIEVVLRPVETETVEESRLQNIYEKINKQMIFGNFYGVIDGGFIDLMMSIILNYSIYNKSKQSNLYQDSGDTIAVSFVFISTFLIFFKILMDFYVIYRLYNL